MHERCERRMTGAKIALGCGPVEIFQKELKGHA